jgi:transcriptional regulator with XRE-family HTH domain
MNRRPTDQLGAFIRRHREAAGLKPAHLAKQMRVTRSMVLYWERGERTPEPESLQKLATALRVDFEDLSALAGYGVGMPGLQLYLRKKHRLTKSDAERVERYIERIKGQKGRRS